MDSNLESFCYRGSPIFGCRQELGIQTSQKRAAKNQRSQCICGNYLRHISSISRHIRKQDSFFV